MKSSKYWLPLFLAVGAFTLWVVGVRAASPYSASTLAQITPLPTTTEDVSFANRPTQPDTPSSLPIEKASSELYPTQTLSDTSQTITSELFWQKAVGWSFIREQNNLFVFSDNDGWFVGNGGDILRWQGSNIQSYNIPGVTTNFNAIDMLSQSDGWIIGNQGTIIHWNGTAWQQVTSPTIFALREIDMVSANDGWIVGGDSPTSVLLHWDGNNWTSIPSPAPSGAILIGVSMLSATDGWAVGNYGTILHWDGISWKRVTSPVTSYLNSVEMLSPTDGWAVGNSGSYLNGLVLHWDGSTWQIVSLPSSVGELEEVDMVSPTNGWATSWWGNHLLYWDGISWTKVSTPGGMHAVQMLSSTNGWGLGWSLYHYTSFTGAIVRVIKADGQPAAGAYVNVLTTTGEWVDKGYAQTDSSGYARIPIAQGTYNIQASSRNDHFLLTALTVTTPATIMLSAVGMPTIALTAKDRNGASLNQAEVSIGLSDRQWGFTPSGAGMTDTNGQVTITVSPGTYDMSVGDRINRYYLVKERVAVNAPITLNLNASADPTADLVIQHPGIPKTGGLFSGGASVQTPDLNVFGYYLTNPADGSRVVLTANKDFSVGQEITVTAQDGAIWDYYLMGPTTYWGAGETHTSTITTTLSVTLRNESAFIGTTITFTKGLCDRYGNRVASLLKRTPPSTRWYNQTPTVELVDSHNRLLYAGQSLTYTLPITAPAGTYQLYYWQDTGPYGPFQGGNSGTMSHFDVRRPFASVVMTADGGGLTSTFDSTSYDFPPGTFTDTVMITHTTTFSSSFPNNLAGIGHSFEITAIYSNTGQIAQPTNPYTVTVQYTHEQKGAVKENTLALYYWNSGQWVKEPTSTVDINTNRVTAVPNHFSRWVIMGEIKKVYLPILKR